MKLKNALVLASLTAALSLGACASPRAAANPAPQDDVDLGAPPRANSGDPSPANWVWAAPANVVYWPWRNVGQLGRGLYDGGASGFTGNKYPILGLVFLPVNMAVGGLTGFVQGFGLEPGAITPETHFGHAMGRPLASPVSIWWYE